MYFVHNNRDTMRNKDFKERFEKYGLELEVFSPNKELDADEIKRNEFIQDYVLITARKKEYL